MSTSGDEPCPCGKVRTGKMSTSGDEPCPCGKVRTGKMSTSGDEPCPCGKGQGRSLPLGMNPVLVERDREDPYLWE